MLQPSYSEILRTNAGGYLISKLTFIRSYYDRMRRRQENSTRTVKEGICNAVLSIDTLCLFQLLV